MRAKSKELFNISDTFKKFPCLLESVQVQTDTEQDCRKLENRNQNLEVVAELQLWSSHAPKTEKNLEYCLNIE